MLFFCGNPSYPAPCLQVYVRSAHLPYPSHIIIKFIVTLAVGLVLAGSYMYYLNKTRGLEGFHQPTPIDESPQVGYYPPWKLAQAMKEKGEIGDTN